MRRLLPLLALTASLLGCGAKPPNLVGTWTSGLGGALTTYHFRENGDFSFDVMFDGSMGHVEGKYKVENGQLHLDPTTSNVQGGGPRVDEMRSQLSQPSRVTIIMHGPSSFQLGLDQPPLIVSKMSPQP